MLLHANINQNSFQFPSERITLDRHNLKNFTTTNFKLKLYSGKKKYFFNINQFNKFCVKLLVTAKKFGIHILSFTLLPLIEQIWCSLFTKFSMNIHKLQIQVKLQFYQFDPGLFSCSMNKRTFNVFRTCPVKPVWFFSFSFKIYLLGPLIFTLSKILEKTCNKVCCLMRH